MRRLLEGHEDEEKAWADEKIHAFFGHVNPLHHLTALQNDAETLGSHTTRRGGVNLGESVNDGESSSYTTWR